MKKLLKTFAVILCVALTSMFIGCSMSGAPEYDTTNPDYVAGISESIDTELEAFVTEYSDRTTFKTGEQLAADYLEGRLTEFGYTNVTTQEFSVDESNVKGLISRNVIARLQGNGGENGKNVVLGAYYDNRYSEAYSNAATVKSESALAGGSGVASLLAVSEYLIKNHGEENKFDYDITIVFFGASYVYADGAEAFLRNGMTPDERKNTVLMVEMQRLGVDYVYAYSDARATKREGFFDRIAQDNKLAIYKPTQKSPAILSASSAPGIPYYQWAHSGVFSVFAKAEIPALNLVGANWETMNLGDVESAEHGNIAYTENDTLKVLKRYHPDYKEKMATAATLVIRSLEADDFVSTMSYDRENYPDTDILTTSWIWYLIAAGVLAIAFAIVFAVNTHLAKKYKPEPKKAPPRLKMAVFGMDYEDKSAADIFIDVQKQNEEIFPGIPNNGSEQTRLGSNGMFPPTFGNTVVTSKPVRGNNTEDIFGQDGKQSNISEPEDKNNDPIEHEPSEDDDKAEAEGDTASEENDSAEIANSVPSDESIQPGAQNNAESDSVNTENDTAKNKTAKRKSAKKAEPQIEIVKSAPKKRATVSAKKSVGAKKSTAAGEKKEKDPEDK